MSESTVTLTVRLEAAFKQDDEQWIAWCLPLDILTQAETKKAAKSALREAVTLWFDSCIERGALDDALRECGFLRCKPGECPPDGTSVVHLQSHRNIPMTDFTPDYIEVNVPAYIAVHQLDHPIASR